MVLGAEPDGRTGACVERTRPAAQRERNNDQHWNHPMNARTPIGKPILRDDENGNSLPGQESSALSANSGLRLRVDRRAIWRWWDLLPPRRRRAYRRGQARPERDLITPAAAERDLCAACARKRPVRMIFQEGDDRAHHQPFRKTLRGEHRWRDQLKNDPTWQEPGPGCQKAAPQSARDRPSPTRSGGSRIPESAACRGSTPPSHSTETQAGGSGSALLHRPRRQSRPLTPPHCP